MSGTAFETLVISQLSALAEGHREIKGELVAVQSQAEQTHRIALQTLEQAKTTNGRVTLLEGWQDSFEDETEAGAAFAAGRQSIRDGDKAIARKAGTLLARYAPYGIAALLLGVGVRLGAWFVGGAW